MFFLIHQLVPSAILALIIHPKMSYNYIHSVMWAFCVYSESVSVLPQLRLMQNAQVSHYISMLANVDVFGDISTVFQN